MASDVRTAGQTFGYLLALAVQNFSLSNLFTSFRTSLPSTAQIDSIIAQTEHRFGKIRSPQAILVMLKLINVTPRDEPMLPYSILKITDRLASASHRNLALLNGVGTVQFAFDRLYGKEKENGDDDAAKAVLQKLLRRLLEMGASTSEARAIYHRALKDDMTIDPEILEVLRSAKRAKWPEYFSFDGAASLELIEDGGRMLPCPTGFTFMVCCSIYEYLVI